MLSGNALAKQYETNAEFPINNTFLFNPSVTEYNYF